ncbi:hypothetical protein TCAL_17442 [Tigriopus californicus]|uniref:GH18 domain-containing protein n=1 Tax=Tigriopus californicus TaxID=6832 RepID=A0A553PSD8_TIGCA|nr:probable chitinase 10 [Tigriopus californicus]TRY80597.1 hypothetical protein TCAL_17442 [Tigriopus californicus]|eukprot:TCALIF_13004-PA protein Name:"Similar to CHIA Acidic mammalian chitinase (Bos taurus)" AED:0.02 eAED:0.02 QI:96/1/1/1/1/1/3/102/433
MRSIGLVLAILALSNIIQDGLTVKQSDKLVVCYFTSWAHYREDPGHFDVAWVDPTLCSHGIYAYADIDTATWSLMPVDPWYDLGPMDCGPGECNFDSYRRFTALASETFTPMLSVGGYNEGPDKFSDMAKDPVKRQAFIDSSVDYLQRYGFQGLDIDWEFPAEEDKRNLDLLVGEMKAAFDLQGLILSLAIFPEYDRVDLGYDIPFLSENADFLSAIAYDYHSYYNGHEFTAHEAPIFRINEEENVLHPGYGLNVYDGIRYLLQKGGDPTKLVMGIPAYGNGFMLEDASNNGLYCPAAGAINPGPIMHSSGSWSFQEILKIQQDDALTYLPGATPMAWSIQRDDCQRVPYMINGKYWIGYEDVQSVGLKAQMANALNLGGVMVFSLDQDDYSGAFSDSPYPLLREINTQLASGNAFDPTDETCGDEPAPVCEI